MKQHLRSGRLPFLDIAVSLWVFGALSSKPLHFKGTWSGLETVRTRLDKHLPFFILLKKCQILVHTWVYGFPLLICIHIYIYDIDTNNDSCIYIYTE